MVAGGAISKDQPKATGMCIYFVIAFVCIGAILFGLDQGNWAEAIEMDGFLKTYCPYDKTAGEDWTLCKVEPYPDEYSQFLAWGSSLVQLGAFFGVLFVGPPVAGIMGRLECMFAGCFITIIGVVPMCLVTNKYHFMAARFIAGVGVGAVTFVLPMFISEVAPPAIRGALGASYQLMMVIGMLLATCLNVLPVLSSLGIGLEDVKSFDYQASFSLPLYPAVIICLGIFAFPPSPRFVLTKYYGKPNEEEGDEKARAALLALRGNKEAAEFELAELKDHIEAEAARPKGQWATLWRDPSIRKRVIIANALQWMQQFTGINALLSFGPTMLKTAELEMHPFVGQVVITCFNLGATVAMISLIDKLGRRTLLLGGAAGMFICMSGSAIVAYCITELNMTNGTGMILLALLCGYISFFGIGWGGVPWVYPSEIFPMDVKEMALSTSVGSQWLANFLIAYLVPLQTDEWGLPGTFAFYAVCLAVNFAVVYFFIPETAQRELDDMDQIFGARLPMVSSSDSSDDSSDSDEADTAK
jgi:sugar porter (SP) family MFS transporter